MNFLELYKTAFIALHANKIRTALTMLGVVIGVGSVILLISIGKGVQNYITDQFEALGSNLIFIAPGKVNFNRDPGESFSRNKLEEKHIKLLETQASEAFSEITPFIQVGGTAKYKTQSFYASISGTNEEAETLFNYEIDKGRFFNKNEIRSKAKVAVLGPSVYEELFGTINPIGKKIKLEDNTYEVVGTYKEKGRNFDEQIVIPYTSAEETFGVKNFSNIVLKAPSEEDVDNTIKIVEKTLLKDLEEDDFSVLSQKDILSSIQNILRILTLGLGAIAGISLIVGGIGIMNIMLVSVTERTREIGLRKAVGATNSDIAYQFIIEATLLSIGGGVIGIIIGWVLSLFGRSFIRTEVPWYAVVIAFSFAAIVGIIFGTYPALKASRKDPIEALRYE